MNVGSTTMCNLVTKCLEINLTSEDTTLFSKTIALRYNLRSVLVDAFLGPVVSKAFSLNGG